MALLKCKMCGGDMELPANKTFGTCEYCGCTMTLPKIDDEQRAAAFNRGNHFRRIGEFDKALAVYERIVREDENDAEAHWCCALCRFGIEYVEDPATFEWLPTCHRASFDSFLEDVDYLAAVEHSEGITRRQYQKDATRIAEVQRGILATSQNTEPYDVFICYKESDEQGDRTKDSLMAQDIYYQLTEQGRRVFFARITLEDVAGSQYEPYIFAALNSARVMVVVGTKTEHLNAVWVKNEWSRFLAMMKKDRHKLLLPCYRDMDPYDLPEQLSVLQSYDMGKIGFIQDLTRGIAKVLDAEKKPEAVKETVVVQQSPAATAPLLKRAFMFLEDGDWKSAYEYCEKVLDMDPECADAYLGKLLSELKVRQKKQLKGCAKPFDHLDSYSKVLRFGDSALVGEMKEYNEVIRRRNEENRLTGIYNGAASLAQQRTPEKLRQAAGEFSKISGYRDAGERAETCRQQALELDYDLALQAMQKAATSQQCTAAGDRFRAIADKYPPAVEKAAECDAKAKVMAEEERQNNIYDAAVNAMRENGVENIEDAIKKFRSILSWRDSEAQIALCQQKIAGILENRERIKQQIEASEKAKRRNTVISLSVVGAVIAAFIVSICVVRHNRYKPLNEALSSDVINAAAITAQYHDLQHDKGALKVFKKHLEQCHKDNDLQRALVILAALAKCDVYFSDWVINSQGNTYRDLSTYIQGWDTFINWIYRETVRNGQQIEPITEGVLVDMGYDISDDVQETYEIYGYTLSVDNENDPDEPYRLFLYVPTKGWYKLDQSAKYFEGGNNIGFHRREGGVMVD